MPDRLYLSCWVRGWTAENMMRHFAKLVRLFPHSKLAQRTTELRVYAFEDREPPVIERSWAPPIDPERLLETAREFTAADYACQIDSFWDLWQFEDDWKLAPSRCTLLCYGPLYERELNEHLRVEFGSEDQFLPQPEIAGSARVAQSNLRSLLHLVHQLDEALMLDERRLWSESGGNFAEKVAKLAGEG
jgi:hypothetical protein